MDTQAHRILGQELRDAENYIEQSKIGVAGLIAERMGVHRELQEAIKNVKDHEDYAKKAMEDGNNELALEIAARITELTEDYKPLRKLMSDYDDNIRDMKSAIKFSDAAVKQLTREMGNVKATENVIKANRLFTTSFDGSNNILAKAQQSINDIKMGQQKKKDTLTALQSLNSVDKLTDKMHKASIMVNTPSPQDVLDKLNK